jgi:hypothetical protein
VAIKEQKAMAGLTDWDEQDIIVNTGHGPLKVINNGSGHDALATTGLAGDGKYLALAAQEPCQMGSDPMTSQFLPVLSQQCDANSDAGQGRILGSHPSFDRPDIRDWYIMVRQWVGAKRIKSL